MLKLCGGYSFRKVLPHYLKSKQGFSIILMYHRVVGQLPEGYHDPAMFVRGDSFDMHIREIKQFFRIVPLRELVGYCGSENLCAITFDDGWDDTYGSAFPILRKYDVPATVFISGNLIGKNGSFWFENLIDLANKVRDAGKASAFLQYFHLLIPDWGPLHLDSEMICNLVQHLKKLPADNLSNLIMKAYEELGLALNKSRLVMCWEEVREISGNGISFAPHGLNHLILPTLDSTTKCKEIRESLNALRENDIDAIPIFSYPNGDWDNESIDCLIDEGYLAAVTTKLGYNTTKTDRHLLNRIGLHEFICNTPGLFWFRIFQAMLAGSQPWS